MLVAEPAYPKGNPLGGTLKIEKESKVANFRRLILNSDSLV